LNFLIVVLLNTLFYNARAAEVKDSIPSFKILLSNGTYYTRQDIPKGKPVILIYFSPDCEHCQKLLNSFFPRIKEFKNSEIVLVTFKTVDEVKTFEQQYQTYKYPNLVVGTEGNTYYLRYYYKLTNTPFTVLYDKKGNMVYSYRKETPVTDLVQRFKNMKALK
jgi:thiol-disulfide isomerase/thioredoxin